MNKLIKLHYFNEQPNFGDLLNEDIFLKLAGNPVLYSSVKECQVVAIGSLLHKFWAGPKKHRTTSMT